MFSHNLLLVNASSCFIFRPDAISLGRPSLIHSYVALLNTPEIPFIFPCEHSPEFIGYQMTLSVLDISKKQLHASPTTSSSQILLDPSSLSFHNISGKFLNFLVIFGYMTQFHYFIVTHFQILKRQI